VRSEAAAVSERRLLRRLAAVMGTLPLLTVAATCGPTYAVVALSKDTAVSGGALVSKDSGAPLATGQVTAMAGLVRLWQGATDAELVQLEAVVRTAPGGAKLVDRVASAVVVPGQYAVVTTATPGLAFRITEDGVALVAAAGAGAGAGGAGASPAARAPARRRRRARGRRGAAPGRGQNWHRPVHLLEERPGRHSKQLLRANVHGLPERALASGGACTTGTPDRCCDPTCTVYRDKNLASGGACTAGTPDSQCCDPLCPCLVNNTGKCAAAWGPAATPTGRRTRRAPACPAPERPARARRRLARAPPLSPRELVRPDSSRARARCPARASPPPRRLLETLKRL
jgi:hypothetical protein